MLAITMPLAPGRRFAVAYLTMMIGVTGTGLDLLTLVEE